MQKELVTLSYDHRQNLRYWSVILKYQVGLYEKSPKNILNFFLETHLLPESYILSNKFIIAENLY